MHTKSHVRHAVEKNHNMGGFLSVLFCVFWFFFFFGGGGRGEGINLFSER